ncbi:MAG TPA: TonB-dependent receptor plug domain-containing protein, partial [Chitinophagales bacterium]|nr:TonB-dependent receptor plug domain-containing protein [Chitinophagales bacterium]
MMHVYALIRRAILPVVLLMPVLIWGQAPTLTGVISDQSGATLPGVTVLISGTGKGTISDFDGSYVLAFDAAGTYTVNYTYIGYKAVTETITLTDGQNLKKDLIMQEDALMLETAVVVGYGTIKSKDLTGSITNVGVKDFQGGNVTTPEQLITGKVAGVQITSNSGMPGSGSRIRIRGGTSLNASNDPLIVIDGVPVDNNGISGSGNALSLINPDDIENITVLKDASAAAIYGSRAANGVIIITTKKGFSDNKLHIDVSSTSSLSQVTGYVDVLTADQLAAVLDTAGTATQQALLGSENTNWQKELYRMGFAEDLDLTFTGGIKNLPYRLNLEYMNESGVLDRSQLGRMGASLGINPTLLNGKLKTEANGKYYHTDNFFADQGAIGSAITFDPSQAMAAGQGCGFHS